MKLYPNEKTSFTTHHICQRESPPAGNRKRHAARGVTSSRRVPQSQPGKGGTPVPLGRGEYSSPSQGDTPVLAWGIQSCPVWGIHQSYPSQGVPQSCRGRRVPLSGLGYPLERTWNQMLGYLLEMTRTRG